MDTNAREGTREISKRYNACSFYFLLSGGGERTSCPPPWKGEEGPGQRQTKKEGKETRMA